MATKKRTVGDADIAASIPSMKRRKLNEEDQEETSPLQTIPLSTESPSASVATNLSAKINSDGRSAITTAITPPVCNPAVNNVNIETKPETQNDHTAKSQIKKDQDKNANDEPSNWSFGNNSWVRQSSDDTQTTADPSPQKEVIPNQDSFSAFAGLGFQKVLDDQNSKDATAKKEGETDAKASKKETETKQEGDPWKSAWSNSNPDGTFKLNFDWGNWKEDNAKIDLNPQTKLGWGSTATTYDPDAIEEDGTTKQVVEQMGGEKDAGDTSDAVQFKVHCKVYNLESGRYVERGKGFVKLNTYTVDEGQVKGRILCRRDQTLTTLINAPILKKMNFDKAGSYLRFGVLEIMDTKEENEEEENENVKKEAVKEEGKGEREKDVKKEDDADEDDDIKTKIKTYLIRPTDKTQLDVLVSKIKEIQQQIG